MYCFICRSSDSTVSEDAGIEPRTVATLAVAVRRSNHSARSPPVGDAYCLGGVLLKHRRLLTAEYVTNNFSRRYTTQQ